MELFRHANVEVISQFILTRSLTGLAQHFDVHPNQITEWKSRLQEGAAVVFCETTATPKVDVTALHAKIGELTLEKEFLEKTLTRAGVLSAKR